MRALAERKEKLAFLITALALVAFGADWALSRASKALPQCLPIEEQRHVVSFGERIDLPSASELFARPEESAYWRDDLPRVWVQPKSEKPLKKIRLASPPPSVPVPPMLLPIPAPRLEFSSALPRWPEFPAKVPGLTVPEAVAKIDTSVRQWAPQSGGVQPLLFEARTFDLVVLQSGEELRGTLLSDVNAETIRLRLLGRTGERAFPRSVVKRIEPALTLEQAHDELARQIAAEDYERWYALALGCLAKGKKLLGRAEADLRKAIKARPTHAPSHVLLARVLLSARRYAEARAAAETACAIPGASDEAYLLLGQALEALGEDPREAFTKALRLRPSAEAHAGLARAELRRGRYAAAEAALADAVRFAPGSPEVATVRGELELSRLRLQEAEAAYSQALASDEDGPRLGLAAARYLQGRFDDAEKALLDADPSNPEVSYMQGLLKLAKGDRSAELGKLFAAASGQGVSRAQLAMGTYLYYELGEDLAAAASEFKKAAAADPREPLAQALAGWCEYRLGRPQEAVKLFVRAAELANSWPDAHAAAGACALLAGSPAEAVVRYRAGLDACPGDARLLAGLGLAHIAGGDLAAAAESLDRALKGGSAVLPQEVHLGLGWLAHNSGNAAKALRCFAAVLSASGQSTERPAAYALDALGKIYDERDEKLLALTFDQIRSGEFAQRVEPFRPKEGFGVKLSIDEKGWLVFAGTQEKQDFGRTSLEAAVDGVAFREICVDVDVPSPPRAIAGLLLESRQGGVELVRRDSGEVVFRSKDGSDSSWGQWQTLLALAPAERARISVRVSETRKDLARLELAAWAARNPDDAAHMSSLEFKKAFWGERTFTVGVFAACPQGARLNARVDNLFLVERAAQQPR